MIEKRLPPNKAYKYTYDADGNVATMTTPRGKTHRFGSTGDDRPKTYTPPGASAYERVYSTSARSSAPSCRAAACSPWATTTPGG